MSLNMKIKRRWRNPFLAVWWLRTQSTLTQKTTKKTREITKASFKMFQMDNKNDKKYSEAKN